MAVIDTLTTAKANIANLIAQITASPAPTYSLDGQSVSWESYLSMLLDKLEKLNQLIQVEGGVEMATTEALCD